MYLPSTLLVVIASFTAAALGVPSNTPARDSTGLTLQQQLELAGTAVNRLALIPNDQDFIFDFNASTQGITQGKGGKPVKADRDTFPALIGSHGSMTLGFLGPCGFNTPHVHPRAAELNIVVLGRLRSSVTAENGARHMNHTMNQFQMTIFPQGALHTEFNPDCTDAVFVAAFPDEDPGVQQAVQTLFGLEDEIVKAALGGDGTVDGMDLDKFKAIIPANVELGVESCLQKCNISKSDSGSGSPSTEVLSIGEYIMRGLIGITQ